MCIRDRLTTGQMIEALQSGKYDLNKTALIMSQTGGGCRATNYIGSVSYTHLLPNEMAGKTIAYLLKSGLKQAMLGHLSKESNFPEDVYKRQDLDSQQLESFHLVLFVQVQHISF